MNPSKKLLRRPLTSASTGAVTFLFIVALLGFADATYLTVEHYRNIIPPCSATAGCETVLTSAYSTVGGVPVSLMGSVYYLAVCIGSLIFLEARLISGNLGAGHFAVLKWTLYLTTLGLLASLYFVFLQAFVIHSYCQYCLGSAFTSTVLFVIAMEILRKNEMAENKIQAQKAKIHG